MLEEVLHGPAGDGEGDGFPVGVRVDLPAGAKVSARDALAARIDQVLPGAACTVRQGDHRALTIGHHGEEAAPAVLEPRLLARPVQPTDEQRPGLRTGVAVRCVALHAPALGYGHGILRFGLPGTDPQTGRFSHPKFCGTPRLDEYEDEVP